MGRFIASVAILLFLSGTSTQMAAAEGIKWGRLNIFPSVSIAQKYSDNIYLAEENKDTDYIVSVEPDLELDLAVFPMTYFQLIYQGDYNHYADADNFGNAEHFGSLAFIGETGKGSQFELKASIEDTSIQPYSRLDQAKDYLLKEAYASVALMLWKITQIGGDYSLRVRKFDKLEFAEDDYKRTTLNLYALYNHMPSLPLLLQYRYLHHDNENRSESARDFVTHTFFIGSQWRPERRLSGVVRLGYTSAEFDRVNGENIEGFAADINLRYDLSPITRFDLLAERMLHPTTISARESGDYYVLTGAGMTISYARWDRFVTRLWFGYYERDFKPSQNTVSVRTDHYYRTGVSISYSPRQWLDLTLGYDYRNNDSDMPLESYAENVIKLMITLGLQANHDVHLKMFGQEEKHHE